MQSPDRGRQQRRKHNRQHSGNICHCLSLIGNHFPWEEVIKSIVEAHEMSLREASHLIEICKPNLECLDDTRITNETVFRVSFMDIVEAGIRVSDPTAYDRLVNNGDYSVFTKEVKCSKGIKDCFVTTFGHCIKPDDYRNMIAGHYAQQPTDIRVTLKTCLTGPDMRIDPPVL